MQRNLLKFTEKEVFEFAQYYNAGHSIKETSIKFNVKYRDVLHYLIYFGYYKPKRKNKVMTNLCENPSYFHTIDTPEKAYFLGLIMSDGSIQTNLYNKGVSIALQAQDLYILEKLNSLISPNKKLLKYKNSYKWRVTSSVMYEDLKQYGITENKSHSEYIFPSIPIEFHRDFIRGYFDGDGCISIKSTGYSVISFCSNSRMFLESLSKILLDNGIQTRPIHRQIKNRKSDFYTLYISGGINKSIFKKFLYDRANIYLIRKFNKFKGISC